MFKPLKKPTTYQDQIQILKLRGIIIEDDAYCEKLLSRVNYYRLSGYLLPFRDPSSPTSYISVPISRINNLYSFDAEIRALLLPVCEKIEIYLRTQLSYYSAHHYGANGYMDANNFNYNHDHIKFQGIINRSISENYKSPVVKHHINEYGGQFPIWVIIDYFSMGSLSHFYADMKNPDKAAIAKSLYSTTYQVLTSWMRCLTDLRNRCAHYSRLYYWNFTAIPKIDKKDFFKADRTLFSQLYMLKLLYPTKENWNDTFVIPLQKLIRKYKNDIDKEHIGFPRQWKSILIHK